MVRSFDSAIGYFWQASHQQVYRELAALTDAGLVRFRKVRQDDKPDKKIYTVSTSGKQFLQAWLEAPLKPRVTREPLLVKLLSTSADNQAVILKELEHDIRRSTELRDLYTSIAAQYYSSAQRRNMPASDILLYVALRKGMHSVEAHLAWLNETQTLISRLFR